MTLSIRNAEKFIKYFISLLTEELIDMFTSHSVEIDSDYFIFSCFFV